MATRKTKLTAAAVAALLACGLGVYGWWEFYGFGRQFDAGFYAAAAESNAPFAYDDYAAVLKAHVDDTGRVDYAALKADRKRLDAFVLALARARTDGPPAWQPKRRLAFWINAYNALTLKAVIDHYPIRPDPLRSLAFPASSIRQIPGVWDRIEFLVAGRRMTLNDIEHRVLRAGFHEPRIHMALVCAALSCPRLLDEPYTAGRLDAQLAAQAREFLSRPERFRLDRPGGRVYLSSIFKWFGGDFVGRWAPKAGFEVGTAAERAVLAFVSQHVGPEEAKFLREGHYEVRYLPYDWTLNDRPRRLKAAPGR